LQAAGAMGPKSGLRGTRRRGSDSGVGLWQEGRADAAAAALVVVGAAVRPPIRLCLGHVSATYVPDGELVRHSLLRDDAAREA